MSRSYLSNIWRKSGMIPDLEGAKCKGNSKPLWDFQVHDEEKTVARARRHNKAIAICRECPVKRECEEWGTEKGMHGVWGGVVLVPGGRSYLRCAQCGRPMIKSKRQQPPRGFRNLGPDGVCAPCAQHRSSAA